MDGGKNRNRAKVALFAVYLAALLRITVFRHNFSLDHLFGGGTLNLSFLPDISLCWRKKGGGGSFTCL